MAAVLPLFAQDEPAEPAVYHLDGDDIRMEGTRFDRQIHAVGNVLFAYTIDGDNWTLSAVEVEYFEQWEDLEDESQVTLAQKAVATGDIELTGPGVQLTAPGSITIDLLEKHLVSDSEDIYLYFENGEVVTDSLEIRAIEDDVIIAETDVRTVAIYSLSDFVTNDDARSDDESNLFGSLKFDFNEITIETVRTSLRIENGEPVVLECADPSTITSATNTLTMPSFSLYFDPIMLVGNEGVDLLIGENTRVNAAALAISYPDHGMTVKILGAVVNETAVDGLPEQVSIVHPAGTFCANSIVIEVNADGTQRIHATGCATFEIPILELLEGSEEEVEEEETIEEAAEE